MLIVEGVTITLKVYTYSSALRDSHRKVIDTITPHSHIIQEIG